MQGQINSASTKKKIIAGIAFLSVFVAYAGASAQTPIEAPSLYVSDLTLNTESTVTPGTSITGAFTVTNNSPFSLFDLTYATHLAKQGETSWSKDAADGVSFMPTQLTSHRFVDYKIGNETFKLLAGKSALKTFSYGFAADLSDGDYLFLVSV